MYVKLVLVLLCICVCSRGRAQNYVDYQRQINRVDNNIVGGNLDAAAAGMDTIYDNYTFIYCSHCVKALQIAVTLNDEKRAVKWFSRSITQGVPLWVIRNNELTKKVLDLAGAQVVVQQFDSLHAIYLSRTDTALNRRIHQMMAIDTRYTKRVNNGNIILRHTLYGLQWLCNNKREARKLEQIIKKHGYPEEKIVGLPLDIEDSAKHAGFMRDAGVGLVLRNGEAFFMFLHYFSSRRKDMNDLFMPQIVPGNMPAYQYARINDYLAINTSAKRYKRYYHFGMARADENLVAVDAGRSVIGLNSYGEQVRNEQRYLGNRKKGLLNKDFVLE